MLFIAIGALAASCGTVTAPGADAPPHSMVTLTITHSGAGGGTVVSSPAGIDCGSTCTMTVAAGTAVVLTATPDANNTFQGWSGGGCTGTGTCGLTLNADTTVGAAFAKQQFTLTVQPGGNGSGHVTSSPAGIDCGASCSATYDPGTAITLTATPDAGTTFVGWTGGGCTGTGTCTVTLSADATVQAAFALNNSLVVTLGGSGVGTVTSLPSGINCPSGACSAQFSPGTSVTLTATPGVESTFSGWSGGGCSGTGNCVVTVNAATGVSATFKRNQYTLTVSPGGTGAGTVTSNPAGISCGGTCSATFDWGTPVTLTASPNAQSTFSGWGGACSGTGSCAVTVTANTTVTASFTASQYTLTVTLAGAGSGSVTSSPAGISCGPTCTHNFNYNTTVTLSATPAGGSSFAGWSGACTGTGSCVVTMTSAMSVTASFTAATVQPILQWGYDGNSNNTGTIAGYPFSLNGATYVTGKFGQAAQFGTGGYGTMASARSVLGVYAQYTISFWVNASSTPNTGSSFLDFENRSTAPYGGIQLYYSSATTFGLCVATTTSSYLGGSCAVVNAPAANSWHNVILRYAGTGTGTGQGAGVDVYEDDVLVKSIANDANNNPVFNQNIMDTFYFGTSGTTVDDLRVYNTTFTPAGQCTTVIGGTWTGTSCTLP